MNLKLESTDLVLCFMLLNNKLHLKKLIWRARPHNEHVLAVQIHSEQTFTLQW